MPCEDAPCCGCCGNDDFEPQICGSGEDDLADYNANEADDYRDEAVEQDDTINEREDFGDYGDSTVFEPYDCGE